MQISRAIRRLAVCAFVLGFSPLLATPADAALIVVGTADSNSGNRYPFGNGYADVYQQIYTSSVFTGPVTITGLEFYNTQVDTRATDIGPGHYAISLSTTTANWNTLSSTFASNLGSDNTTVFSGSLAQPWTFGNTLAIGLTTPFTFNPASGNLLMTVHVTGSSGEQIYFDWQSANTAMGRVYSYYGSTSTGTEAAGQGLVTGFSTAAVPEPATLLLFGSGLLGAGLQRYRRR